MLLSELVKEPKDNIVVSFNGKDITIKQYLPIEEKQSLINIALTEAKDSKGVVDTIISDALFNLYVVVSYSDIELEENPIEMYDVMEMTGIIDFIVGSIPEVEYETILEYYNTAVERANTYATSIAGAFDRIIGDLPSMLENMNDTMEGFDPSQLQVLGSIMKELGGNSDALMLDVLGQK